MVMSYRSTGHLNFAQGEMPTFSTFTAWQMIQWGISYWIAFILTLFLSFIMGAAIERALFRRVRESSPLVHVVLSIALYDILNSLSAYLWNFEVKSFPTPFGVQGLFGGHLVGAQDAGMIGISFVLLLFLSFFFQRTRIGLAMRAAAENPESARLSGIDVGQLKALGWGMASVVGAVAGLLIAPTIFLDPNMMSGILLYGFAGAVLGGLRSPVGAVLGGLLIGLIENLAGLLPWTGQELKLTVALLLIIAVLVVMPAGIVGTPPIRRG
jgi:branched-chain amino acid transport system permease protein